MARFVRLGKDREDAIFSGSGAPLSTLSSKIIMGHALGLFGPLTRKDLDIVRSVRNLFAHTALPVSFINLELDGKCKKLSSPERLALHPEFSGFGNSFDPKSARDRFIYTTRSIAMILLLYARNKQPYYRKKDPISIPTPPADLP